VAEPGVFKQVQGALVEAGVQVYSADLTMMPQTTIPVEGGEARQVLKLIEALEELDDVQNVYANFDIPEEVMASL
jgi:transcriptional/translational regulatory protein YebC/TACO1